MKNYLLWKNKIKIMLIWRVCSFSIAAYRMTNFHKSIWECNDVQLIFHKIVDKVLK